MSFTRWKEVGFEAVEETANLVSLTILFVAAALTIDPVLLGGGMAAEVAYLFWAVRSSSYQKRGDSRAEWSGVLLLDRILLVVTVAGVVVIMFFRIWQTLAQSTDPVPAPC